MLKLVKYLRGYTKESILAPLFKLLEASFELLVPLVMAGIIDHGIAQENTAYIVRMGAVLVGLAIVGLCSAITAQYFSAKAAAGFGTALRDDLFRHILGFSHAETDLLGRDTFTTRMTNDTNQIQAGVNLFFRLVLRSPFIVFGALVMSFSIDVRESLIFVVVIALLAVIVASIMGQTVKMYKQVQKRLDDVLGQTSENLTGVRVIRAFSRQSDEISTYKDRTQNLSDMQIHVGNLSALMDPLTYVVINLGIVAILKTGSVKVNVGTLTQGEVVALVNYMSQILVELVKVANLIINMSKASACARRVNEVFAIQNSLVDGKEDALQSWDSAKEEAVICFKDVNFSYPNAGADALEEINFSVNKGQMIGVIGGTGSGKSTLVNLIPRFYDVRQGEVEIAGKNVKEYSLSSLRRLIGIVEQKSRLFKGSIRSNLLWGDEQATDEQMNRAASIAQAAEVINKKEGRLDEPVRQLGANFSGGQKQRLSITRTLVKKPKVLILDDSSSALDYATDAKLRNAIKNELVGTTVFMVSQRISSIRHADQILVLDDGRIVGMGKHEDLVKHCQVYQEICMSQLSREEVENNAEK